LSEEMLQVAPSIDDSDDFDFTHRPVVGVRVDFVKNQVRPFDENAGRRRNVWSALKEPRISSQHFHAGLHLARHDPPPRDCPGR